MNTPDKCPHCGADTIQSPVRDFLCWSRHGDHGIIQSDCCKVRAELAATKRELEAYKTKANRCEDEMNRQAARANNSEGDLELSELSVATLKNRAEVAEARVRGLEGWIGNVRAAYRVLICASESERREAFALLDLAFRKMGNLGEAMPRKVVGDSKQDFAHEWQITVRADSPRGAMDAVWKCWEAWKCGHEPCSGGCPASMGDRMDYTVKKIKGPMPGGSK